jgi:hypothetical protein
MNDPDAQKAKERRKLDRDMDRLERVLTRMLRPDPQARRQTGEEERRWRDFERASKKRFAEIKKIGARSDAKLKALIEEVQKNRSERRS